MIYAIAAVLVLIADQAMKFWTAKTIPLNEIVEFIPGVLQLTNIHNYGAAFNILQNARWLLIAVTVIFVVGIIILMTQEIIHTKMGRWTMTMILAGAIGNCIDRVLYGYVVDMFEFQFFTFPVFNVADIFITIFGILFCIHVIFHNEPEEVKAANEPAFMRRRRQEREELLEEDPYAAIPRRGVHKTLEEELRADEEDSPFGDWTFGGTVEEEPAPTIIPLRVKEPEPQQETAKDILAAEEDDLFSLDDILSEFGDF